MADPFSIAERVLGKIASLAFQEAVAIYGVEKQISELRETLTNNKAVSLGVENQQAKNPSLEVWLDELQDVLYDADDVLDELECVALRKNVINRYGKVKEKVRSFLSLSNPLILRHKLIYKIKEIKERLSTIYDEKDQFDINLQSAHDGVAPVHSREMTYSFINKSDVIGRNTDKKKIIEMLMQPTNDKNLSVIPIIGIGGMGKTTLAKFVYNDDSVKEQFELRLWVSVSEDFDLKKIIEGIIKDPTGQSLTNLDIQQLQTRLLDIIKGKKYLLVLDDVWSNDCVKWKELRELLSTGASESKIIVTTRNLEVASIMGTCLPHNLQGLSHEDCMALFERSAFSKKDKEHRLELLDIGNDIVKKSQGMPLLVIILGGLLRTKDEEIYWASIRDSETWDHLNQEVEKNIMPVLKLSYDNLPSHLKKCFSILSLFPKGDEIEVGKVTRLWMALGLLSSEREKLAPEDVGLKYVKELRKRSLIQDVEKFRSELRFKMLNSVHFLAMSVGEKYFSAIKLDAPEISERLRCVSIPASLKEISNYDGVPPFLRSKTLKRLHAILFQKGVTRKFVRTCISKCKHLRFLDLSYGNFEELSSSICNLKQLRSLNLSENKRLKKLPNFICELQSLLHLDISGCLELGELPKNMKRLINLRYLYITTKQESLQESGIQYLKYLDFLGLKECVNLQILFEGTCGLTQLRELLIKNCERLVSLPFGELNSLRCLSIESCPLMLIPEKKTSFPSQLRELSIANFEKVMELLQCLNESAYTLESFHIYDCQSFTAIPEWLPNHTHLKQICLIQCPNLSSIPQGIQSLTALKELRIVCCGELSKRCERQSGEDWHKIAHVPRIKLRLET